MTGARLRARELDEVRHGLRFSGPIDEPALAREAELLDALARAPWPRRFLGHLRLIGPGYLQSAMTLGAGTASSSLFAGAVFGYDLLWVGPVAMLIGVVMLAAIAHQTLSTGARPMRAVALHAGKPIAIAWAAGALAASVVWHFPQYNLAANSLADLAAAAGTGEVPPMAASAAVLAVAAAMPLAYGRSPRAVRAYERVLKWMVWIVVLSLLWVVLRTGTDWAAVLRGFLGFALPPPRGGISSATLAVSALAAAVGINMAFLYPYSLLARGWGPSHRSLARWDLVLGMAVPYVLATGLCTIAAANTLHRSGAEVAKNLSVREASLVLGQVLGPVSGRLVFDVGMLAMALSTISLHMLVCGFVASEWLGLRVGSMAQRLFTLLPAPAFLAPWFWGDLAVWLAVPTTIACGALLPIAYLGVLRLQCSASYLGEDRPRGAAGALWLAGMVLATLFATGALVLYLIG
ncbi:MAG: divalent metal cation transporter [Planctomycetota bacterium]